MVKISEAYKTVYEDMLNSGCDMLFGKYDAKNGDEHFMFGICSVMEWISERAGELDEFNDLFFYNMSESEKNKNDKL